MNKYAGTCAECGNRVPARGGECRSEGGRWVVRHLACKDAPKGSAPRVIEFRFSSGASIIRNVRGTCEDAPCCGCCTF